MQRRNFLQLGSFGLHAFAFSTFKSSTVRKPIVISTWDAGIEANKAAWKILSIGGRALDAVEQGVMVTESSQNCCVGLGANPDRDGFVTLIQSFKTLSRNTARIKTYHRRKMGYRNTCI